VATRWLAEERADAMAVIGTGKQALMQVAAVAAVRKLRLVRVHSPRPESRRSFIAKLREEFPFEVVEAGSVAHAVEAMPIVTTVTRATTPFLAASMLSRATHVNAVGAITPERSELEQDVFARASIIAVDSVPAVQKLSTELIRHFGASGEGWGGVRPLAELVANERRRISGDDLSIFKAMGVGIADLALAAAIYRRAHEKGRGRPFPHPKRVKPRIGAAVSSVAA